MRYEPAVEFQHPQEHTNLADFLGRSASLEVGYSVFSGCKPLSEILYPRNVNSEAPKTHFPGLSRIL